MAEPKAETQVSPDPGGGFYVFWMTGAACGASGSQLTRLQADKLAARIAEKGPDA
ncbi:MAG: hypothetical protein ABW167_05260 [Baekduia sp.]